MIGEVVTEFELAAAPVYVTPLTTTDVQFAVLHASVAVVPEGTVAEVGDPLIVKDVIEQLFAAPAYAVTVTVV